MVQQLLRWHSKKLDDARQLVTFVLAGQKWVSGQEFGQNASQAPHIDGHAVPGAQDDLGGSVKSGLDVGVHPLVFVAGAAEIDNLKQNKKDILTLYSLSNTKLI